MNDPAIIAIWIVVSFTIMQLICFRLALDIGNDDTLSDGEILWRVILFALLFAGSFTLLAYMIF